MIALAVAAAGLAGLAAVLAARTFRRRFVLVHVRGRSMLPTFRPGDRVLVRRAPAGPVAPGTVAVLRARHAAAAPAHWVIKRVAAVPGDPVPASVRPAAGGISVVPTGQLVVLSDNPRGNDSRRWGLVSGSDLIGPVIATLPPGFRSRQCAAAWRAPYEHPDGPGCPG